MSRLLGTLMLVSAWCAPVLGANCSIGECTYFWLSTDNFLIPSPLPDDSSKIPEFHNFRDQDGGSFYIWARPELGQTLENWSLNLRIVGDSNIIDSMSSHVYKIGDTGVNRWQAWGEPGGTSTQINNISGLTQTNGGQGIGPTTIGSDAFFNSALNAWLLARVDYELKPFTGFRSADLYLQIGSLGITNTTGSSALVDVVFGDDDDTPLNASNAAGQRQTNSSAPDGVIKYFDKPDADFDDNAIVTGRDFLVWQRYYGTTTLLDTQGNANAGPITTPGLDDKVNGIDLAAWRFQYRNGTVNPTIMDSSLAVPEPSSLAMAFWIVYEMLGNCRFRRRNWPKRTPRTSGAILQTRRIHLSVANVTE